MSDGCWSLVPSITHARMLGFDCCLLPDGSGSLSRFLAASRSVPQGVCCLPGWDVVAKYELCHTPWEVGRGPAILPGSMAEVVACCVCP